MPSTARPLGELQVRADQRVVLHNAVWTDYERLQKLRGESAVPRLTFDDGMLEIMSPGEEHEDQKSVIGCLVEAYCLEQDIEFTALGSWTLKRKRKKKGLEPDECYQFGPRKRGKFPDLAIEVRITSGGIDKLAIYRALGIREVWFREAGRITVHRLGRNGYRAARRSGHMPGLDLALLCECAKAPSTSAAIKRLLAALRA